MGRQRTEVMRHRFAPWLAAAALAALSHGALASPTPESFPYVIPWDDAVPGTATNMSGLNAPITESNRITAVGPHFYETLSHKRVRFFGVNFAADAAFPTHADAEKVALHLAKIGVNMVRLHHMDSHWSPGSNIWIWNMPDRQHFDPNQVDRLFYLIAQLKKRGVYVDVNLHVGRDYTPADGFPAAVSSLSMGKRVDNFDRRMIALQKKYAHDLLSPVNPYTKLRLADDPAVAFIEINNENSLVGDPWAQYGAGLDTLPEPFLSELRTQWNLWLRKRYRTRKALQDAWMHGVPPPGRDLLTPTSQWTGEHEGDAMATWEPLPNAGSTPGVHAVVTAADGTNWHTQVHITGLSLAAGHVYTLSFKARADKARTVDVTAALDQADWHDVGLTRPVPLGTDWSRHSFVFTAHDTVAKHVRLTFSIGQQTGDIWISDPVLVEGVAHAGLEPDQSPEAGTVSVAPDATPAQQADWLTFLSDTETAYAGEMRGYIRHALHAQASIIDTQVTWGGLFGLAREARAEYRDNHAYWQHPEFPHIQWDAQDWRIGNSSMAAALATGTRTALHDLAEARVEGRPYVVSEYNHPAPSDFQAEALPMIFSYAALQDWDGVILFDYGSYGAGKPNEQIQGFFEIGSNPAKSAFFPSSALLFRTSLIAPLSQAEVAVVPPAAAAALLDSHAVWHAAGSDTRSWMSWLSLREVPTAKVHVVRPDTHADSQNTASSVRAMPWYSAQGTGGAAFAGSVGNSSVAAGPFTLTFGTLPNNFAAGTLVALDHQPMARSHHLLLTVVGRVQNTDMVWNSTRTSVGNHWGTAPSLADKMVLQLSDAIRPLGTIYPLTPSGERLTAIDCTSTLTGKSVQLGEKQDALCYEMVR